MAIQKNKLQYSRKFCGLDRDPEASENVLHVVDLAYIPAHQKNVVKEHCLKSIRDNPNSTLTDVEGVIFLNDN